MLIRRLSESADRCQCPKSVFDVSARKIKQRIISLGNDWRDIYREQYTWLSSSINCLLFTSTASSLLYHLAPLYYLPSHICIATFNPKPWTSTNTTLEVQRKTPFTQKRSWWVWDCLLKGSFPLPDSIRYHSATFIACQLISNPNSRDPACPLSSSSFYYREPEKRCTSRKEAKKI
jgi:hypothetical protein